MVLSYEEEEVTRWINVYYRLVKELRKKEKKFNSSLVSFRNSRHSTRGRLGEFSRVHSRRFDSLIIRAHLCQ